MRRRPLKKMKRDPSIMIYGVIANIIVMVLYYWGLYTEAVDDDDDEEHDLLYPTEHGFLFLT